MTRLNSAGGGVSSKMEDTLMLLLPLMGFEVRAVELSPKGVLQFKVLSENTPVHESALFAFFPDAKVGAPEITRLKRRMGEENLRRLFIISPEGFTSKALEFSSDAGIELWDSSKLESIMAEHGLRAEPREKHDDKTSVYDKAFAFGKSVEEARKHFESKAQKSFFGFGKPVESVESVSGCFEPLGVFNAERVEGLKSGGRYEKSIRKNGVFYVSLASLRVYHLHEGALKGGPSLRASDFLSKAGGLPRESCQLLSEVVSKGRVSLSQLDPSLAVYFSQDVGQAYALQARGLVGVDRTTELVFTSNVDIPEFGNRRFDLSRYINSQSRLQSRYPADDIKYRADEVSDILSSVFSARVEFECVIYLPYYQCKYVDGGGGYRFDRIIAPNFKPRT